jgi:hypothetical protein
MINKTGLTGLNKNLTKPRGSQDSIPNLFSQVNNKLINGRVTDIVLDENHPRFDEVGGLNGIGTIFYETGDFTTVDSLSAKPLNSQNQVFPLINEFVTLFLLPDNLISSNLQSPSYYYISTISIWNHPHHNAYPNLLDGFNDNIQKNDYDKTDAGSVRRVTDNSTEIDLNSKINPSQNTFKERTNIHPLMPFMGDVIYEGRFGNSIRLGTTAKSLSKYKNTWSTIGTNGDPITIFRNGQPSDTPDEGWIPITENINDDLSSIYLTSTQQLNSFKVASELYQSYKTPPTFPSQYSKPQVILNSDRVVINAKKDSVLLSAETSIGMSTNGSVNIDAKSNYISSNDIKLGSKNATQPVLLGDDTVEILKQLTGAVKDLATILQVQRDYPEGALVISANAVALNVLTQINNTNGILAQLNNNSLKSKTTKVQ